MSAMPSQHNTNVACQEQHTDLFEQGDLIRMSLADQICFANALLSPPQATLTLQRAMARHTDLIRPVK